MGGGSGSGFQEHATELARWLDWSGPRFPSEATLRRALREVDLVAMEGRLAQFVPATESPSTTRWQGQALDGKAIRGARAHGRKIHLVGLVSHQGRVLGQLAVAVPRRFRLPRACWRAGIFGVRPPPWMRT